LHGDDDALLHPVADDDAELLRLVSHDQSCLFRFLPDDRLHTREIPADGADLPRRLELPHGLLDAQPEQLIGEVPFLCRQFVAAETAKLRRSHRIFSCANRVANFVRIGSFDAASFNASRASPSVTPSISNSTRPGRITATHCSGAPLPFPMRVSCGFFVIGLSGNTRTQIFPPPFMKWVLATRPASIFPSVRHQGPS